MSTRFRLTDRRHGVEMDDPPWVTITEAARQMGISRTAIRNRMTRGTMPTQAGNHGQLMTQVVLTPEKKSPPRVADLLTGTTVSSGQHRVEPGPTPAQSGVVPISVMTDALDRQQRQHEAEISRLERAWRGVLEAQTEKYLRVMMANRSRPWWRWW